MIWQSIPIMTAIDIVIILGSVASIYGIVKYRDTLLQLNSFWPTLNISIGVLIISTFYFADIYTMIVLPRLTSREIAMAAMRELHQNWSWPAMLAGVGCIVFGLLHLLTRLMPRIVANVEALQSEVAERKSAESRSRKSAGQLEAILDHAPVFIALKDTEGRHLVVGSQSEQIYGLRREDAVGKTPHDLFDTDIADRLAAHDRAILETGQIVEQEDEIPLADGVHIIHSIKFPVPDGEGGVAGIGVISSDITERKRAEADLRRAHEELEASVEERTTELREANEALRGSETSLADAQRIAHLGSWDWNIVTGDLQWSDEIYRIFGLEPREFGATYEAFMNSVHPEDREIVQEAVDRSVREGAPYQCEHRVTRPDGSERVVFEQGEVTYDAGGAPVRMVGAVLDITERKRADEALRQSEKRLADAQRRASIGNLQWSFEHQRLEHWSDELLHIFGLSREQAPVTYDDFDRLVHSEDRERLIELFDGLQTEPRDYEVEFRIVRSDGAVRYIREIGGVDDDGRQAATSISATLQDITERRRTDQALRESEARLNAFFDNAPLGLAIYDTDLCFVRINQPLAIQSGLSIDEHIGRSFREIKPEIAAKLEPVYKRILETGEPVSGLEIEAELPSEPGEKRWWWGSAFATVRPDGTPSGIGVVAIDVTERKRAEQELRESEARLNAFFDNAPIGLAMYDTDLRYTKINSHLAWKQGMSVGAHIGRTLHDIKPDVAGDLELIYRRVLEAGEPNVNFEVAGELLSDPGTQHWWWGGAFPATWSDGKPSSLGVVAIDITERKRAEEEVRKLNEELEQRVEDRTAELAEANVILKSEVAERARAEELARESEERLREFLDNTPATASLKNIAGEFVMANHPFKQLLGIVGDEYKGKRSADYFEQDLAQTLEAHDREVMETGHAIEREYEISTPDGDRTLLSVKFPVHDAHGVVTGIGAIAPDITERKRMEKALRESEAQLRLVTDNMPALIAYLDSDRRYRFANKTYCEWARLPREKLEGQYMRDVLGPDAYRKLAPRIDAALLGQPVNFEEEMVFPDNRRRNIEVSYVPEIVDDGGIKGIFVLVRDVTERKRTEEALRQARDELARKERLAVLGQLTATVSHELRNPLGTMRSSMFVLDKAIDQADERASRAADRINRSIVRCDRIIDDLLDFTRAQALDRQPVVVDEWLAGLLDELAMPDGVELARDLAAPGVSVEIDPERLRRAVVNLYENACQAVSDEHPGTAFGPRIAVSTQLRGRSFEIAVSDTGRGIAPDNLGSIFEPLFSTKPFGTGLGLPTVKRIVEGHGGTVEVETGEGRGTTFRLLIPLHRVDEAAA